MHRVVLSLLGIGWLASTGCSSAPLSSRGQDREITPLRIATWNIKHGRGMDGRLDLERTAAVIAKMDVDIVALQEVDDDVRRSGGVDQATWLAERLGMQASFGPFMDYQGGRYGLAILSRIPIQRSEVWRLPDGHEPRVALSVDVVNRSGPTITVAAVHFDWVEDDDYRFAQATETMRRLHELETPWIVLGDFNDTPESRTMRGFHALGLDAVKPMRTRATYPADEPEIEIDFIVAGPGEYWSISEVEVFDESIASDHRPVVAVLRPSSD